MWAYGEDQRKLFLSDLNEFYPNLERMYEKTENSVIFLDLHVDWKDSVISIDGKPTAPTL